MQNPNALGHGQQQIRPAMQVIRTGELHGQQGQAQITLVVPNQHQQQTAHQQPKQPDGQPQI